MKKWIPLSLFTALVLMAVSNCSSRVDTNEPAKNQSAAPAAGKTITFVELGSVNCIPCKMMQPVMKEIEEDYGRDVKVVFYDVWTATGQPYGAKYGIRVIPTQVFLDKDGKEFFRHEGYFPKEEIVKLLKSKGIGK